MLLPAVGATAQARDASSSVALDPTAISSGRQLNSRAADACSVANALLLSRLVEMDRPVLREIVHPLDHRPLRAAVHEADRGGVEIDTLPARWEIVGCDDWGQVGQCSVASDSIRLSSLSSRVYPADTPGLTSARQESYAVIARGLSRRAEPERELRRFGTKLYP
jgi:hypothetical protein